MAIPEESSRRSWRIPNRQSSRELGTRDERQQQPSVISLEEKTCSDPPGPLKASPNVCQAIPDLRCLRLHYYQAEAVLSLRGKRQRSSKAVLGWTCAKEADGSPHWHPSIPVSACSFMMACNNEREEMHGCCGECASSYWKRSRPTSSNSHWICISDPVAACGSPPETLR